MCSYGGSLCDPLRSLHVRLGMSAKRRFRHIPLPRVTKRCGMRGLIVKCRPRFPWAKRDRNPMLFDGLSRQMDQPFLSEHHQRIYGDRVLDYDEMGRGRKIFDAHKPN